MRKKRRKKKRRVRGEGIEWNHYSGSLSRPRQPWRPLETFKHRMLEFLRLGVQELCTGTCIMHSFVRGDPRTLGHCEEIFRKGVVPILHAESSLRAELRASLLYIFQTDDAKCALSPLRRGSFSASYAKRCGMIPEVNVFEDRRNVLFK